MALVMGSCKDDAKQEILDVFDAYNAAVDSKNGDAVLPLIDEKYFEEIDRVLAAARTAPADKVFRMQAWERLWVVAIRNRLTKEEMAGLTGRSLFKLTVDRGWNLDDLEGPSFTELGKITFKPPRAFAELVWDGFKTGLRYEFVKIDNTWKIDPMCEEEYVNRIIEKLARITNSREDMWIKDFESAASGKRIGEGIWSPPK